VASFFGLGGSARERQPRREAGGRKATGLFALGRQPGRRAEAKEAEENTMNWPYFEALLGEAQGVPVLRTSGDVILATVSQFRAVLEKAVKAAVEQTDESAKHVLVVDLRETEFMDSVGLGSLIGITEGLRKRGGEARLVSPSAPVRRMLEVTGLSDVFRVYPDVQSAIE
jgi:anti-anti-sigma factor